MAGNAGLFQHRHFVYLADIIKRMDDGAAWPHEQIATHFADWLAATNTNFDRERFLAAAKGSPVNRRDR